MRTTFRLLLIGAVVIGLLGSIGTGIASWWIMRKLGPEFWVQLIEENTNCRAEISAAKLSLLSYPSTLKLKEVRLAPRDAEFAKPYEERAPIVKKLAPITIPEITLEVKLEDLINRRLFIQRLKVVRPEVREIQDEHGHGLREQLFLKPPGDVSSAPPPPPALPAAPGPQRYSELANPNAPSPRPPSAPAAAGTARIEPSAGNPSASKTANPSTFAISVASAEIEQGHLTIVNKGTTVDIQNLDYSMTGIDVNPRETSQKPPMHITLGAEISVSGLARIGGVKKPAEFAHVNLSGNGDVSLNVDPRTGLVNPTSVLKLTLAKGSALGGHMTIGDAAGKEIKKLQEYGIDLSPVPIGGPLQEAANIEGVFSSNRFTLRSPTRLIFPEYELAIDADSWLNGAEDEHYMRVHLFCGASLQQRLETGIANAKLGDSIARGVTKALSDDRGRLTFDIVSSGPLSEPKVKPSLDRLLKNLLKGESLGDLFKGLLKLK